MRSLDVNMGIEKELRLLMLSFCLGLNSQEYQKITSS